MSNATGQILASCLLLLLLSAVGQSTPVRYFVSQQGDDDWSGTIDRPNADKTDGPFATLTRARDALRGRREATGRSEGATVIVGEGTYIINKTIELTQADSGSQDAPIIFRAEKDKQVRLVGGTFVRQWEPVDDPAILKHVDVAARKQIVTADLKALNVGDYGSPASGGIELFFNRRPLTLSRWPNQGFVRMVDVLGKTRRDVRGTIGCAEGIFTYEGDRPQRWLEDKDIWVHGYWFWDWSDQRHPVKSIDTRQRVIEVEPPYHGYGYRRGQWFYAFNLLSEIDQPGEWYLDRQQGRLYLWPPAPTEGSEAFVSVIPTIVNMNDVSYCQWRGFTFEGVRGTAIRISGGTGNRVVGCTIRNVGDRAIIVSGGTDHGVVGCDVYQTGGGGISLSGGDPATLTPGGHFADNNHIHHYARIKRVYQPGITLAGVGNRATHNLIHHAPHMGMGFSGNDHLIQFNEIHNVCDESNDAGAIYTGRNWTMRGTAIRDNYLHHISGFEGRGCVGVYLDDMFCGTEISGNLFYRVTRAAMIGGGRDCTVNNNLFVECRPALHIDARALGWAKDHADKWIAEAREHDTLSGIRYRESPYKDRYPTLPNILDDEPGAPKGNRVEHNVSWGGHWDGVYEDARKYQIIEDNLVDEDPLFATPERMGDGRNPRPTDFAFRPDSPAWAVGFKPLKLTEMGLYEDENRASWPIKHEVR